jgi:hypothetical protein
VHAQENPPQKIRFLALQRTDHGGWFLRFPPLRLEHDLFATLELVLEDVVAVRGFL